MTKLAQLCLDFSLVGCGMSYVFTLDDGSFFLIDGGYFTPGEEDRLFRFLKDRSTGKPHIAGWFFSHAHQDHVGNFIQFIRKYRDAVQLDRLLYNFQPYDFSDLSETVDWRNSDPATFREFYRALDDCCAGVERRILKTGDRLRLGELTLDVLYTHEDLDVDVQSVRFNDCSTVLRVTANGQRILFLGDVYVEGCRLLMRSPEALDCEIVQVAHHGFSGATVELYRAVGARVALWPTPDFTFENMRVDQKREANLYLLNESEIQEHWIAGQGDMEFTLPYTPGTAR